jgi:hypothetical protein
MKLIHLVVHTALVTAFMGVMAPDAWSVGVDLPTNPAVPCVTSQDCANGQYCNSAARVCYYGVAVTGTCTAAGGCPAGSYCHAGRCHVGMTGCTSNAQCKTFEYCHFGICHAEACTTDADCPLGVQCIAPLKVCALP